MNDRYVLYDGACPVCSRYVAAAGLAERGDIALLDARAHLELVAEHAAADRAIDEGMVVAIDGTIHHGASATRRIAELVRPATPVRRFLLWFVGLAPWSTALYPVLATARRWLLRILGRPLIASE
jgi:predicted DCC family thiol-disulfide oxidoreductase YuxK